MPQYDPHVYPVFRTKVRIEAESLASAKELASLTVMRTLDCPAPQCVVGDYAFEYADEMDTPLVDVLDGDGNVQESVEGEGRGLHLDAPELATLLAALRHWQRMVLPYGGGAAYPHFDDAKPLSADEIDDLCERLNSGVRS